jgi:hypothetical protein
MADGATTAAIITAVTADLARPRMAAAITRTAVAAHLTAVYTTAADSRVAAMWAADSAEDFTVAEADSTEVVVEASMVAVVTGKVC